MNAIKTTPIHSLLTVSKDEPIGKGITRPHFGKADCVVKQDGPSGIVGEYLSYVIAQFMGLPVAPGFIAMLPGSGLNGNSAMRPHYVVMRLGNDYLPRLGKATAIERFPEQAAGLGVFDRLVANTDRHDSNMSYVGDTMVIFDHGYTCIHLDDGPDDLAFVDARNSQYVEGWIAKAQSIPYALLENAVNYLRTFDWEFPDWQNPIDFDNLLAMLWERVQNLRSLCIWEKNGQHIIAANSYDYDDDDLSAPEQSVCDCADCNPGAARQAAVAADPLVQELRAMAVEPRKRVCSILHCPIC